MKQRATEKEEPGRDVQGSFTPPYKGAEVGVASALIWWGILVCVRNWCAVTPLPEEHARIALALLGCGQRPAGSRLCPPPVTVATITNVCPLTD